MRDTLNKSFSEDVEADKGYISELSSNTNDITIRIIIRMGNLEEEKPRTKKVVLVSLKEVAAVLTNTWILQKKVQGFQDLCPDDRKEDEQVRAELKRRQLEVEKDLTIADF